MTPPSSSCRTSPPSGSARRRLWTRPTTSSPRRRTSCRRSRRRVARARLHRSRQMDGRLGVAPQARPRPRRAGRRHRAPRARRRRARGRRRHGLLPRQLPRAVRHRRVRPRARARSSPSCSPTRREWIEIARAERARRQRAERLHRQEPGRLHAPAPAHLPGRRRRAPPRPRRRGPDLAHASAASRPPSISRRSRTAARCSRAATCSSARSTTSSSPAARRNMSDGWETKRRRGVTAETHDWVLVRLTGQGIVDRLELDTNFFKGNFPDTALVVGRDGDGAVARGPAAHQAHGPHAAPLRGGARAIAGPSPTSVSRSSRTAASAGCACTAGSPTRGATRRCSRYLASRAPTELRDKLRACCASPVWVERIASERPFDTSFFERIDTLWSGLPIHRVEGRVPGPPAPRREEGGGGDRGALERGRAVGHAQAHRPRCCRPSPRPTPPTRRSSATSSSSARRARPPPRCSRRAKERLQNAPDAELRVAAEELRKIMHLRLRKLVGA